MRSIKILGHRGAIDGTVYQNTVAAFEIGMQCGGFETDFSQTADHKARFVHDTAYTDQVINDFPKHIHDDDKDIVGRRRIDQLDDSVVDQLHLNHPSKPRIPQWSDIINLHKRYPDSVINLELKGHDTATLCFDLLSNADIDQSKFVISSFNHPELLKFRKLAGQRYKIAALMALPFQEKGAMHPWDPAPEDKCGFYTPLKPEFFAPGCQEKELLDQINPDYFNLGQRAGQDEDGILQAKKYNDIRERKISLIKELFPKAKVMIWTFGEISPEENAPFIEKIEKLAQENILEAVITNYPREMKALLENKI